jgi:lipopolysaccharide transport system permease protein
MLWQTTWNEIKTRYAGSVFGLAWLVFYPLLFLGVYSLYIFAMVTVRQGESETAKAIEQVLLIFCGLIPFFGFSEALGAGTTSVSANANLIKNTLFPIELIPAKAVLVGQATQIVGMGMLIAALGAFGKLTPWALLVPFVWLLQIVFSIGLVWILSSLHVFFRDLQNVIAVAILMLMLLSPIAYKGTDIPPKLMPIMYVNPLYYLIVSYQDCLLYGQYPRGTLLPVMYILAIAFLFVGFWFFGRMKRAFSDNI